MIKDAFLRKVDLNLLLAFSVLMQERNVTRAAERLFLGQPAMSAALKRLREALGDELFVRVGRGLQPTPRALAIAPVIEDSLSGIESVIRPSLGFDPVTFEGELKIGLSDTLEWAFVGPIVARLRDVAPRVTLVGVACDTQHAGKKLDGGAFEFSVGIHEEAPSWHVRSPLFNQASVCIYDPKQLAFNAALTIDDFTKTPHVAILSEASHKQGVEAALDQACGKRHIAATVPHYGAIPTILRAAPVIATVPESIGRCVAKLYDLRISMPPIPLPAELISMLYRRVDQADIRAMWFRRLFIEVATEALIAAGCDARMAQQAQY